MEQLRGQASWKLLLSDRCDAFFVKLTDTVSHFGLYARELCPRLVEVEVVVVVVIVIEWLNCSERIILVREADFNKQVFR